MGSRGYKLHGMQYDMITEHVTGMHGGQSHGLGQADGQTYGKPFYYLLGNVDILFIYKISYKV